jgi:PEP-CTERM motif
MRGSRVLATARASFAALAFVVVGSTCCPGAALSATKRTDMTPFSYNTSGIVGIGADPSSVIGPAVLQFQGVTGASYDPAFGQAIPLGQFVINPSTPTYGLGTIYNGTPFEVEIQAPGLDKTSTFPVLGQLFPGLGKDLSLKTLNENSVILKGTLTGTVSGSGQANVVATVDSVKLGSLDAPTQDHITHYTFPIHFSQLVLPAGWVLSGSTVTVPTQSNLPLLPATLPITAAQTPPTVSPTAALAQTTVAAPQFIVGSAPQVLPAPSAISSTIGTPTPTPEPSTILLFATAFGGLALVRRRRSTR